MTPAPARTRPRVAVVYHFFPHYRAAVMQALLASEAFDVIAVGDHTDHTGGRIEAWSGCPPERFVRARCHKIWGPLMVQPRIVPLALRRDLDILVFHGNMYWPATWLAAIVGRVTGKRVYFWTHGWTRREPGLRGRLRRLFYRLPHAMMVYGHFAKMVGIEYGFAPERLHAIHNSLDYDAQRVQRESLTPDLLAETRRELFDDPSRPIVVCTTRLIAVRGLDELLDAAAALRRDGHPVNLLLVGEGPERDALERKAADLGLAVRFYGACYDEAVLARLVRSAAVTVAPGKVGLTAMHSLAYGTPVITHDDPEAQMPEWEAVIPGRTGDVFPRGDIAALAAAIRRWTPSPEPPAEVRRACASIVERFWSPDYQRRAIERCLAGLPADDLFWMREETSQPHGGDDRRKGEREREPG